MVWGGVRMRGLDELTAGLAGYGVPVLVSGLEPHVPPDASSFLVDLARSSDPRIRVATIALWLARPDLAGAVPPAIRLLERLEPAAVARLRWSYQAAVFLQRRWLYMIELYTARKTSRLLPDLFGGAMQLPSPEDMDGQAGLLALAEMERGSDPAAPYAVLATYESAVELLRAMWLGRRAPDAGPREQAETLDPVR